jgi:metal-sulfur cluster biosynthetic enzyme
LPSDDTGWVVDPIGVASVRPERINTGAVYMQTAETIRKALRGVRDPELNLNIIDLGLVYEITVSDEGDVHVQMTLTSPGCPVGPEITQDVHDTANDLEGVNSVEVEIVWEPYWTPEKIDPRVRAFLGM